MILRKEASLFMTVLMQVLTLFLLMFCGLIAVKSRLMTDKGVGVLNTFVLNFALVGLIISTMQQDANPELIADLAWMFLLTCVTIILSGAIAGRFFVREPHDRKAVLTCLCMVSNCAYMGYPILTAVMGEEALIYGAVFSAGFNLICWTVCARHFAGKNAASPARLLKNPSLIAVIIGMVLFLTGIRLPSFVNDTLSSLGNTTTPLAMFVIGARLVSLRPAHLKDKSLLLVCLLRLVVFPLILLGALKLTPLSDMVVKVLFLCTAMPCASMTAMQAELFDCDKELASRGVALSTALSLLTIPFMLTLI